MTYNKLLYSVYIGYRFLPVQFGALAPFKAKPSSNYCANQQEVVVYYGMYVDCLF